MYVCKNTCFYVCIYVSISRTAKICHLYPTQYSNRCCDICPNVVLVPIIISTRGTIKSVAFNHALIIIVVYTINKCGYVCRVLQILHVPYTEYFKHNLIHRIYIFTSEYANNQIFIICLVSLSLIRTYICMSNF